jgi:hypothetical protein
LGIRPSSVRDWYTLQANKKAKLTALGKRTDQSKNRWKLTQVKKTIRVNRETAKKESHKTKRMKPKDDIWLQLQRNKRLQSVATAVRLDIQLGSVLNQAKRSKKRTWEFQLHIVRDYLICCYLFQTKLLLVGIPRSDQHLVIVWPIYIARGPPSISSGKALDQTEEPSPLATIFNKLSSFGCSVKWRWMGPLVLTNQSDKCTGGTIFFFLLCNAF